MTNRRNIFLLGILLLMLQAMTLNAQQIVKSESGYQLVNKKGKVLTPEPYDDMGWSDDANPDSDPLMYINVVGVSRNGKWGVINTKGKEVTPIKYDQVNYFSDGLSIVADNGRFGAINTKGEEVIPLTFQKMRSLAGNKPLYVVTNNGLQGLINPKGDVILPIEYISIKWAGTQLLAAMTQKGTWHLVDYQGKLYANEEYSDWTWNHKHKKLILDQNGRKGMLNETSEKVFDIKYKSFSFTDSTIIVDKYPELILGDIEGDKFSTWNCDSLSYASDTLVRYYVDHKVGIARLNGENIFFNLYDEVGDFEDGLAIIRKKNTYGVCNTKGKLIIPLKFKNVKRMPTGHFWTLDKNNFTDIYSEAGKNLTYHNYDMVGEYSQGKYLVKKARKYGYLDSNLKEWISPKFSDAESFVGPYAVVRTDDYYGVIDLNKNWVITPIIDRLKTISEGLFYFEDNQMWGTLSVDGYEWYRSDNATVEYFEDGYVIMKKGGKFGLLTNKGELCLSTSYDSLKFDHLSEGRVDMYIDSTWLYKDVHNFEGEPKRDAYAKYDEVGEPHEVFTKVKQRGRYGFMDYLGRMRLTVQYEDVKGFSEGLAPFKLNNRWGFINKGDHIYLQPRYDDLYPLVKNMAKAKKNNRWGVINSEGKVIIPFEYENIERTPYNNWYVWEKGGKKGIYKPGGVQGIYGKYQEIDDLGIDYVIVEQHGLFGLDRIDGFSSWSLQYQKIKLLDNKKWVELTKSKATKEEVLMK
ncbi:WG repeat-containing protein [Flammeovirga sp. MY04]|uniref:WG repeat-containing protein n=1 Tax=Flammeovirga sp. MY04 TaxID=1191459 RepID=UPI0009FE1F0B|nr:WG repeat-containing protein [Flammeovirga sp. MY04]ANQ50764.2 WG repeat-containing protein [Flammeovirga sp. MY04]